MRKELTSQLEECIKAHNIFQSSPTQRENPDNDWLKNIEQITTNWYGRIDKYISTFQRAPSAASLFRGFPSVSGTNSSFSFPSHIFKQPDSVQPAKSHQCNSVYSTSHSQTSLSKNTPLNIAMELAEEKLVRQHLQTELQRLQSTISQSNQQYVNEATMRTQTIDAIAEDNKKLTEWLKERNEALAKEHRERQDLEASFKRKLCKQQRLLEDEKLARQADHNHSKRELELRIGELTATFDKKLASCAVPNTAGKTSQLNGVRPKQQTQSFFTNMYGYVEDQHIELQREDGPFSSPSYKFKDSDIYSEEMEPKGNRIIDSTQWSVLQNQETLANNRNSFSVFRLPKLDLQPFDGDSKKWVDFIAIYRDLVHQNSSISMTQKMAILKQCLTQDIRDGLGDSLSSPALYEKALRELEETYGHPQLVSRFYIQSLINLPKLNMNDYKSLLKASQNISESVVSLKSGSYENELYSVTLMELVQSKMPTDIQSRWRKKKARIILDV